MITLIDGELVDNESFYQKFKKYWHKFKTIFEEKEINECMCELLKMILKIVENNE